MYATEIKTLEYAANQLNGFIPSAAYHPDMGHRSNALMAHAAVLHAAEGSRWHQQNDGYDWQERGRIERALQTARELAA